MFVSMPASSAAGAAAMASVTGLGSILRRFDAPAKIVERIKMKSEFFPSCNKCMFFWVKE
jgi:hypothetical protein